MQKVLLLALFIISFFQVPYISAESTNDSQKEIILRAELIQKYIVQHKENIQNFIDEYNIKNNISLDRKLQELNTFSILIYKIQTWQIKWNNAKKSINQILTGIKRINEEFKWLLKKEKEIFENKLIKRKVLYSKVWLQLSQKLDQINIQIAKKVLDWKTNLSDREKQLRIHMIRLNNESKKLQNINNIPFKSEQEIKQAFIRILKNIRREMLGIKETIQLK